MSPGIDPRNLTAQLHYRAAGNPPSTQPDSAISNCYPGLEFDFRNIWRRLFEGLEMHEADNYVIHGDGELARLEKHRLLQVGDCPTVTKVVGPQSPGGDPIPLKPANNPDGVWTMEWSNAMATIVRDHSGELVPCYFTPHEAPLPVGLPDDLGKLEKVELRIRPLFETDEQGNRLAVLAHALALPGELTQSLCSPWQNDYRECACYYWAASRPDYVNVEPDDEGTSDGNSWLAKDREPREYVLDNRTDTRLVSYEDLFRDWQGLLRHIVGGRDHD